MDKGRFPGAECKNVRGIRGETVKQAVVDALNEIGRASRGTDAGDDCFRFIERIAADAHTVTVRFKAGIDVEVEGKGR